MRLIDRLFGWYLYDYDGKVTNGMYLIKLCSIIVVFAAIVVGLVMIFRWPS